MYYPFVKTNTVQYICIKILIYNIGLLSRIPNKF